MCLYEKVKEGQTVVLSRVEEGNCNGCGYAADPVGSKRQAIYRGHVLDNRYGFCDRFDFVEPFVCPSCGMTISAQVFPCASSGNLFSSAGVRA